jgi:hypothetical protein
VICGDEDPQTAVEWFLVFDITCEVWELLRLRGDLERVRSKAQRTGNLPPMVESPSVAEGDEQSAPAKREDRVEDVAGEGPRGGQL